MERKRKSEERSVCLTHAWVGFSIAGCVFMCVHVHPHHKIPVCSVFAFCWGHVGHRFDQPSRPSQPFTLSSFVKCLCRPTKQTDSGTLSRLCPSCPSAIQNQNQADFEHYNESLASNFKECMFSVVDYLTSVHLPQALQPCSLVQFVKSSGLYTLRLVV